MSMSTKQAKDANRELPNGWRWVKLGEVTTVVNGTTPESGNPFFWNGNIVWITPTDLGKLAEPYIHNSDRRITKAGFDSRNLTRVPPRSIVLSSRAPIGHLGIAAVELCTNQGCKSFIPNDDVDEWFLYYALKRSVWKLQQLGSGATFAEISKTQLESFSIPLPPPDEQQRIAGVLREQMTTVDKARAAAQARLDAVKVLPAAFLRKVFPQLDKPLPVGWRWVKMGDICEFKNGINFTAEQKGAGVLTVDVLNMYSDSLQICTDNLYRVNISLVDEYFLKVEDILIVRSSVKREGVGWPSLFPGHEEPVTFCGFIIRARLFSDQLYPQFIVHYLRQEHVRAFVVGKSGTGTITNISQSKLKQLMIPYPSLDEQQRITALLNAQTTAVDKARTAAGAELETINALPSALLRRAFNGEI